MPNSKSPFSREDEWYIFFFLSLIATYVLGITADSYGLFYVEVFIVGIGMSIAGFCLGMWFKETK